MEQKKELNFINLYNEKGKKHGYWEVRYSNGQLDFKGHYVDGKRHGYWEIYYSDGNVWYKGFYDQGRRVDCNPDEPQVTELSMDEIAYRLGIPVEQLIEQLKIKK